MKLATTHLCSPKTACILLLCVSLCHWIQTHHTVLISLAVFLTLSFSASPSACLDTLFVIVLYSSLLFSTLLLLLYKNL